jgi:hypothetical protein
MNPAPAGSHFKITTQIRSCSPNLSVRPNASPICRGSRAISSISCAV